MRFENKVALVTGGNFGIGRGIAHKFAAEGARIAIVARNEERANHVVKELTDLGHTATFFKASSTATFHGNWGLYGVAKIGVEGMTRSFAAELAPYGIRVNAISPGWIETSPDETAAAQGDSGAWEMPPSLLDRMGTPEEIANTAAFLASDEASFITGQTLVVDGGLMILDYPSRSSLETVGHRVFSHSAEAAS